MSEPVYIYPANVEQLMLSMNEICISIMIVDPIQGSYPNQEDFFRRLENMRELWRDRQVSPILYNAALRAYEDAKTWLRKCAQVRQIEQELADLEQLEAEVARAIEQHKDQTTTNILIVGLIELRRRYIGALPEEKSRIGWSTNHYHFGYVAESNTYYVQFIRTDNYIDANGFERREFVEFATLGESVDAAWNHQSQQTQQGGL